MKGQLRLVKRQDVQREEGVKLKLEKLEAAAAAWKHAV
jgi:hypothetical protein